MLCMMRIFKKILIIYLVIFLTGLPCANQSFAAKRKSGRSVAVVEVYDQSSSPQLSKMHLKLEYFLKNHKNIHVVSGNSAKLPAPQKIVKKPKIQTQTQMWTSGDECFMKAKNAYLDSTFGLALSRIKNCVGMLKNNPGISGNLFNAYLLKSQIEFELGNDDQSFQSTLKAISYNFDQNGLNSANYSPRMRYQFKEAYHKFLATNKLTHLTIVVEGGISMPIYVNGILRGTHSSLTIEVPRNSYQMISTGGIVHKHMVQASQKGNTVTVSSYNSNIPVIASPVNISYGYLGLRNAFFPSLVSNAQGIGNNLRVNEVVLIKVDPIFESKSKSKKYKKGQMPTKHHQMLLSIVDVKRGYATQTQLYDIPDIEVDADRVARLASNFIAYLSQQQFASIGANHWSGTQLTALQKGSTLQHSQGLSKMATVPGQGSTSNVAALQNSEQLRAQQELDKIEDPHQTTELNQTKQAKQTKKVKQAKQTKQAKKRNKRKRQSMRKPLSPRE